MCIIWFFDQLSVTKIKVTKIIAFFAFILSEMGVGNINVGYPKVLFEQPRNI